jgi:hypothetical protein
MRNRSRILLCGLLLLAQLATAQSIAGKKPKKAVYEDVDFEDMMRRYLGKEKSSPLEGIYSVSCVITKRSKIFLSKRERIRVVERKDNYARVALLHDWPGSKREFIEVSLSYRDAKKYPIVGEISSLSEGNGYIYKHLEPDGTVLTFSMIQESAELLEAEYSEMQKRRTITYRVSYLKTYPKTNEVTVYKY